MSEDEIKNAQECQTKTFSYFPQSAKYKILNYIAFVFINIYIYKYIYVYCIYKHIYLFSDYKHLKMFCLQHFKTEVKTKMEKGKMAKRFGEREGKDNAKDCKWQNN